jgi:hypothetical protein
LNDRDSSSEAFNLFDGFSYRKVTDIENSIGRPTSFQDTSHIFTNNLASLVYNKNSIPYMLSRQSNESLDKIQCNKKPNFQLGGPKTPKENNIGTFMIF